MVNEHNHEIEKLEKKNSNNNKNEEDENDDGISSEDEEEDEEVYNTPSSVLKNLYIANDGVIRDETFGLISRNELSKQVANQICFYVYCALRPFLTSPKQSPIPPTILMIGTGFIGSTVLKMLIDCECKPLIRIYSRGDVQTKHWSSKEVKCGTSIKKLLKNHAADIVIMCSELTSTNTICKQLLPFIKPHTFFITSTFGLQRIRLFSMLKTPNIFRTFQDPDRLVNIFKNDAARELEEKAKALSEKQNETTGFNLLNPEQIKEQQTTLSKQRKGKESAVEKRLREAKEKEEKNKELGIIEDDDSDEDITIMENLLDDDEDDDDDREDLNEIEISADLIAKRLTDIRHLVFLLENYYALKGIPHVRSRREALISIFGYVDEFESTCPVPLAAQKYFANLAEEQQKESESMELESKDESSSHQTRKLVPPVRELLLLKIMQTLFSKIAETFQKQFSKYILVVDLPQATELGSLHEFESISSIDVNDKVFDDLTEVRSLLRTPPPPEPIHNDKLIFHILEQDRKLSKAPNKLKDLLKSLGVSSDEESDADMDIYDGYVEEEDDDDTIVSDITHSIQNELRNQNKFKLTTASSPKKLTTFVDGEIAILSKLEQKEREKRDKKKLKNTGKLSRGTSRNSASNSRGGSSIENVEGMIDIRKDLPPDLDTPRRNAALRAGHMVDHSVRDITTIDKPPSQYNIAASKNIKSMFIKEPEPKNVSVPVVSKDRIDYFSGGFADDSLSQLSAPFPDPVPPTKENNNKK